MPDLPTGTLTFLFTDIEGSTKLLRRLEDRYRELIGRHHGILREAIAGGGGTEVGTEGDAFFAVFASPAGAVAAAVHAQRSLSSTDWPEHSAVRVRMGLHTGDAVLVGDQYMGMDIHLAARIAAAAHGGQVLISETTRNLVEPHLPTGVASRDLGRHRLKDIEQPVRLWDLVIDGLSSEFPALKTLEARPTNLPRQRTSFVGREREVADLTALLADSRLVTVIGPGGTGKTRLALRVASDLLDRFADGVFFVDLAPITDPSLVPPVVAQAMVVRDEARRDPVETLADHLRDRQVLLVIDNAEQVIGSGVTVSKLLDAAPRLTVLATSRIPFRISGERTFAVSPLGVPDAGGITGADDLESFEAVKLFTERAAAVRPGFRLTAENAPAVEGIVTRLDGLPLAIELAASRLNVLDPETLLDRLGRRLSVLSGGARDAPERQRTLRATIEWSHDLLGPSEQQLFGRLAVFSGGWTIDAAEIVCGPDLDADVIDGLGVLVDSSMVRQAEPVDGERRFDMLETIREFAGERLTTSGETPDLRRRHAEHFRGVAEDLSPWFFYRWAAGAELGSRARRLDREGDNVRGALEWSLSGGGGALTGLRLGIAMSWYWQHRGHLAEGRGWMERLVAVLPEEAGGALRARALLALGDFGLWQGDVKRMVSGYEEARRIAEDLADPVLLAIVLLDLADVPVMFDGDFDRGDEILAESLANAERAGNPVLTAEIRARAAASRVDAGLSDPADARGDIEEAIEAHRRAGADHLVALNLNRLGYLELMIGDFDASDDHYRQALELVAAAENVIGTAIVLRFFAIAASKKEQHDRVARLVGVSDRIQEEVGGGAWGEMIGVFGDAEGAARRALGEPAFEEARAEGHAMDRETAVAYALEP
jgi:predicted ATPase/class 3 adenylate cyclase